MLMMMMMMMMVIMMVGKLLHEYHPTKSRVSAQLTCLDCFVGHTVNNRGDRSPPNPGEWTLLKPQEVDLKHVVITNNH